MEVIAIVLGIVALIVLPFVLGVLVFRPLVLSIADRIAGKKTGSQEIKELRQRVHYLEDELSDLRGRLMSIEHTSDFSRQMLEDMHKKIEDQSRPEIADQLAQEN